MSSAETMPERKPLARGLKGTNPMPSSSQAGMTSRSHMLHDRVLALHGRQRSDGVGAADLFLGGLGLAPAEDFALGDEFAHDGRDVLHGDRVGHPVLVVQLDVVGPESGEGRLQVGADLPAELGAGVRAVQVELGGDDDLVADGRRRSADEVFVGTVGVDLRGVEEGAPQVERLADQVDGFRVSHCGAVTMAETHGAQSNGADLALAEDPCPHGVSFRYEVRIQVWSGCRPMT
ncbi:hypothetical protein DF19_06045 [Streptomyces olindensis]|nr:hypothetical protein DF19_06045 [Streptomyces olindensis]